MAAFLMLLLSTPFLNAQQLDRGNLRIPQDYDTWSLVPDCMTARMLFDSKENNEAMQALADVGDREPDSWTSYSGTPAIAILQRGSGCAKVRLIKTGKTGWVSSALIPTPEEVTRATAAREKAEQDRQKAQQAQQKAEQERTAALAKLPALINGNESIFIGSDKRCAEQFVEATRMEGLEKRKRLADLISYQCGFIVKTGTRVVVKSRNSDFVLVEMADGENVGKSGWVAGSWLK